MIRCPQSTFFDRHFDLSCVPPPESPVVNQRVVEPEGLASSSFGVASGQCHRAPALRSALVVPHLLIEETPGVLVTSTSVFGELSTCHTQGRRTDAVAFRHPGWPSKFGWRVGISPSMDGCPFAHPQSLGAARLPAGPDADQANTRQRASFLQKTDQNNAKGLLAPCEKCQ